MRSFDKKTAAVLAVIIAILVLTPVFIWTGVLSDERVTQTETFQLHGFYGTYQPADVIVTVTASQIMRVAEGFDKVDVKVDLVNHGNISNFKVIVMDCFLGTLEKGRLIPSEADFHVFGENGTSFQAIFELDPKESISDARIQIGMDVEVFYDDGHSIGLVFYTEPVFGFYDVQNRLLITAALGLCGAAIAVVAYYFLGKERPSVT